VTIYGRLAKTGIHRIGTPKTGFRYRRADGDAVSRAERERIIALRIPPAWTDVVINASAQGAVQAIGKDAAGRLQYRYHAARVRRREQEKYGKLADFASALPRMRRRVEHDVRMHGLPREKALACVLRILATCFVRPGSQVYTREHGSHGITTVRRKHVVVKGDLVTFDFPGKSGKHQHGEIRDRRVARVVRECLRLPGREVFKWLNPDGTVVGLRRKHINDYIKDVMGRQFSAKDFRTWAGTLVCACALAREGATPGESKTARKRKIVAAVKETAAALGNTPAICRSSYIYPPVLTSFERGQVVESHVESMEELATPPANGLHAPEKALIELLRREAA
jgi:DNA topoisomerase-1